LSASGPGTVVVDTDPLPFGPVVGVDEADGDEVEEDDPGTVVDDDVGGFTAKLDPVTTTTSALCEAGRTEPTSMVLGVVAPEASPSTPPAPLTSPGS
jgi:hypothetical protein